VTGSQRRNGLGTTVGLQLEVPEGEACAIEFSGDVTLMQAAIEKAAASEEFYHCTFAIKQLDKRESHTQFLHAESVVHHHFFCTVCTGIHMEVRDTQLYCA
jgi:hypothetical protein